MFISYNWLRELTGTRLDPQELRDRLTNVGLAVDALEARGDDFLLDVEVPSNRGDCLSHIGIARELAVSEKSQISNLKSEIRNSQGKTGDFTSVEIRDPDLCPRYAARIVRGVKIAASPAWLQSASKCSDNARSITWPTLRTMCCTSWANRCTRSTSRS